MEKDEIVIFNIDRSMSEYVYIKSTKVLTGTKKKMEVAIWIFVLG